MKTAATAISLNKKLAARAICKTAALVISLRQIAKRKALKDLPSFMTDPFSAAKDTLEEIEKESGSIRNTGADFAFQSCDIDRAIIEAKSCEKSMKSFIASASKMMANKGE